MTDADLHDALTRLGLSAADWRAVALLPLVQVAWADGRVQTPERARILAVAHEHGLLDGPAGARVRGWLERRPDDADLDLGRRVLAALIHRHHGPGEALGPDELRSIEARCLEVAEAAGGFFDLAFTVESAESVELDRVRAALRAASKAVLDDLPSPEGGSFRDL
jgi:hypothetical protein